MAPRSRLTARYSDSRIKVERIIEPGVQRAGTVLSRTESAARVSHSAPGPQEQTFFLLSLPRQNRSGGWGHICCKVARENDHMFAALGDTDTLISRHYGVR